MLVCIDLVNGAVYKRRSPMIQAGFYATSCSSAPLAVPRPRAIDEKETCLIERGSHGFRLRPKCTEQLVLIQVSWVYDTSSTSHSHMTAEAHWMTVDVARHPRSHKHDE